VTGDVRDGLPMRTLVWAVVIVVVLIAAIAQASSVALFGPLGRVPSLARAAASDWPFAAAHATGVDRFGAVRAELARAALVRDEPDRAAALVAGLPSTPTVADLRGRIALAAGRNDDAVAAFGEAGDVVRAEATIDAVAARDPLAGYDLAAAFAADAVRRNEPAPVRAEAAWRAGQNAAAVAYAHPAEAMRYNRIALGLYRDAVRDDGTQEAYLLADGLASLVVGDVAGSRDAYRRAVTVVPDSVDGYVGVAVSEARDGNCSAARDAATRARTYATRQHRTIDIAAAGYDPVTRAAAQRCLSGP
jgi:tetratricopeptide (TPR) repeat protein